MKIIRPVTVTDAVLTSSTVAETDYAAWNSGTTYSVGNRVIRTGTHRIYESLQDSNTNHTPEDNLSGDDPWWLEVGPTNRWAMFDEKVGTQTVAATSLTVVLAPGRVNSLALLNIDAAQAVVTQVESSVTIYSKTIDLTAPCAGDWYSYFYSDIERVSDYVLGDLLPSATGTVQVVLSVPSGNVKCGGLVVGMLALLGGTRFGARVGITDYSRKATDAFGNAIVVQRAFSKRNSVSLLIERGSVDAVVRLLSRYRATQVVWIGADNLYSSLIVFGFFKEFQVDINGPKFSYCTLEIEGMT